jgi:hypothetical protein
MEQMTSVKLEYYGSGEEENAAKQLAAPAGKSAIYVIQENSLDDLTEWRGEQGAGAGNNKEYETVQLNNKTVRLLAPNTYYMAVIDPGRYQVGVRSYYAFSYGTWPSIGYKVIGNQTVLNAETNRAYFYETLITTDVGLLSHSTTSAISLNPVTKERAQKLMQHCRLSESFPN